MTAGESISGSMSPSSNVGMSEGINEVIPWLGGMSSYGVPDIPKPSLRDVKNEWRTSIGPILTGQAPPPSDMPTKLDQLNHDIRTFYDRSVAPSGQALIANGVDPQTNFTVHFRAFGYAGRRWIAAGANNAERRELNKELSRERADAVLANLRRSFSARPTRPVWEKQSPALRRRQAPWRRLRLSKARPKLRTEARARFARPAVSARKSQKPRRDCFAQRRDSLEEAGNRVHRGEG